MCFYFAEHTDECSSELLPEEFIKFDHIFTMSAKDGRGIDEIKQVMRDTLDHYAEQELLLSKQDKYSRRR